jgi:hypothetical protein
MISLPKKFGRPSTVASCATGPCFHGADYAVDELDELALLVDLAAVLDDDDDTLVVLHDELLMVWDDVDCELADTTVLLCEVHEVLVLAEDSDELVDCDDVLLDDSLSSCRART